MYGSLDSMFRETLQIRLQRCTDPNELLCLIFESVLAIGKKYEDLPRTISNGDCICQETDQLIDRLVESSMLSTPIAIRREMITRVVLTACKIAEVELWDENPCDLVAIFKNYSECFA